MHQKIKNIMLLFCFLTTQIVSAQSIAVTGVVADYLGEPLPGVNVVVKGTNKGIVTDENGKFNLSVPSRDAVLVFSYISYVTQEITVGDRTNFSITLSEDIKEISEVIVVGYGTVSKSDLTGSVASLKTDNATDRAITSVEQLLQGAASGVQITQSTGGTGAGMTFNIRGATSITGNNQPLIILDGYPINSDNSTTKASSGSQSGYLEQLPDDNALANLNPNDIASIEILKDASSTAIYGSRGANGVVLITTKRGFEGRDKVEYSFRYDVSQVPKHIDVLSTADYVNYVNEARVNSGLDSTYSYSLNPSSANYLPNVLKQNTNWQDLVFRDAAAKNHQLTVSGGSDKMKYSLALGYYEQDGIIKNSNFKRGSLRVNLDRQVNNRIKIGLNMSGVMSNNKAAQQSSNRDDPSMSVISGALRTRPTLAPLTPEEEIDQTIQGNPLTLIELSDDQNKITRIITGLYGEYNLLEGLFFRAQGGIDNQNAHRDYYNPRGTTLGNLEGGYAFSGDNEAFSYSTEFTVNLNRKFNRVHSVNAVAGYQWQQWNTRLQTLSALNFPNDNMLYYNLGSASSFSAPTTRRTEAALASWFGRVVYSYDSRYLFTFTGRTDGSTRLSEGNKWHFFPAVAVGWNIHRERFMREISVLSQFKIRGSYGLSGNQTIGIGATKASLGTGTAVSNQTVVTSYSPSNMANDELTWETTTQGNIGFDISFYKNRFRFSFDYYNKLTKDLLISLTIPPSNGFTTYNTNQGEIENHGLEFELGANVLTGAFAWDVSGNISFNRNKIKSLGELTEIMGSTFMAVGSQSLHIARVGHPLGMFYGYRIIGIYQTPEEVEADNNITTDAVTREPGLFKYKNLNGDNVIDADDREIIGNPYPDYFFGLTNNFSWKGFNLSVLLQGSIGQDVINAPHFYLDALTSSNSTNVRAEAYENRWTGPGTSNKYPKPVGSGSAFDSRFSDFIVEDASYVRIKNVTLSYRLPVGVVSFINDIRLFATAGNILTFTNYTGYDPEINSRAGKGMMPGVDSGSIPQYKTFSIGFNLGF
jgi:TonB-linked SusC/RagA family outer membrane protein